MNVRMYRVRACDSNEHVTLYQGGDFKTALTVLKHARRAARRTNEDSHYTMEYLDNDIVKGELACYE